jgi:hypothetical protein
MISTTTAAILFQNADSTDWSTLLCSSSVMRMKVQYLEESVPSCCNQKTSAGSDMSNERARHRVDPIVGLD